MGCSFDVGMWQPVMAGLFWAVGILVAATVLLYAAVLALGAVGERRATRARLARLHRVTVGAERDHQLVADRCAPPARGVDDARGLRADRVDALAAGRLLDRLAHADVARVAVSDLIDNDDPDFTHRGEEIDEAVANYRLAVDRLSTTWSVEMADVGPTTRRGPAGDAQDDSELAADSATGRQVASLST